MASHKAPSMLTGYLTKAAQSFPDKLALSAGKFEISYSRLQELIEQSASVLQSMVIMFQAVMRARGVAAPLDPAYTQEGLEVYLSVSKSKLLLTDSNGYPPAQAAASKLGITQVTVSLPNLTGPVHISVPTLNGDSTHGLVHDFSNDPSDGALLLHNSGTTSGPKVITLTQHHLAVLVQSIASVCRMTDSDSTVVVLPMFCVHGLPPGLLSPLSAGRSVTLASLGSSQDHITIDVELEVPAVDLEVGLDNQTSLPESLEENTGSLGDFTEVVGLDNQTSLPESPEQNTISFGVIAEPPSCPNRSNGIWHLMYVTACNFVSNATVGVLYLGKNLQGCNETYQRAELIASVAAPIAVAVGTSVASILFASNPEKWNNCISFLSMLNVGMTVGGPLSFNLVRN